MRAGELSPVELTRSTLDRIAALDGKLGAFRLVCAERAIESAHAAETALRDGRDLGPLHGIPFVAKDLFDVAGLPTTAGTRLLADNVATRDSTAVSRLVARGMVLVGKTNTVQFAYGGAGVNHDHGTPHNPWHREPHLPGGSSSGTAVAIAAGMAPAGLGTDTGGSVRIPAAFCGITGLKTTVGRPSDVSVARASTRSARRSTRSGRWRGPSRMLRCSTTRCAGWTSATTRRAVARHRI